MQKNLSYYATGEKFFRNGEAIFLNKAYEEETPHLHAHDFIEIAYVAEGQGIHIIDEKEYSVQKGNLFIINYDVPHEFRSVASFKSKLVVYNCVFKPEFLNNSLAGCKDFSDITNYLLFKSTFPEEVESPVDINLIENENNDIYVIYEKMFREYSKMAPGYTELLRAYLVELLITVFRIFHSSDKLKDPIENSRNLIIEKAILYLKDNFAKDIKLDDLSMLSFLSKNYFCKVFKECTGQTVFEYAQNLRINEACRLLRSTDRKIIDIAMTVGYKDLKFFNNVFKRHMNTTPSQFRKFQ